MLKWYSNMHSRVSVQHTKSINLKSEIYDKHHGGGVGEQTVAKLGRKI